MRKSDYSIEYSLVKGIPVHNIFVRLNDEFVDYLKQSESNKERYDEIVLKAMKFNNFSEGNIEFAKENGLCNWDDGILDHLILPTGSAVGLVIEHDTEYGTIYRSHNVDTLAQMSVLMTVITNYLSGRSISFQHSTSKVENNYKIWYAIRDRIPYHSISVEISDDFSESLKSSEVNKEHYDELAIDAMNICGVDSSFIEDAEGNGVCGWDGGLLKQVMLPYGDATGLILEHGTPQGDVYRSHNLDSYSQMAVLMTVITSYLSNMDDMFSCDF
ncbi:MAG: hypothetical protein KAR20_08595 [Candidatus Heimdallarchaeota archaeon]|nr:hypothetical protein [Candidatus Heimdallarchaeota archaeon]